MKWQLLCAWNTVVFKTTIRTVSRSAIFVMSRLLFFGMVANDGLTFQSQIPIYMACFFNSLCMLHRLFSTKSKLADFWVQKTCCLFQSPETIPADPAANSRGRDPRPPAYCAFSNSWLQRLSEYSSARSPSRTQRLSEYRTASLESRPQRLSAYSAATWQQRVARESRITNPGKRWVRFSFINFFCFQWLEWQLTVGTTGKLEWKKCLNC